MKLYIGYGVWLAKKQAEREEALEELHRSMDEVEEAFAQVMADIEASEHSSDETDSSENDNS